MHAGGRGAVDVRGLRGARWAAARLLDRLHAAPVLPHRPGGGALARGVGALLRPGLRGVLPLVPGAKRRPQRRGAAGAQRPARALKQHHTPLPRRRQHARRRRGRLGAACTDHGAARIGGRGSRAARAGDARLRVRRARIPSGACEPERVPVRAGRHVLARPVLLPEAVQAAHGAVSQAVPDAGARQPRQGAFADHRPPRQRDRGHGGRGERQPLHRAVSRLRGRHARRVPGKVARGAVSAPKRTSKKIAPQTDRGAIFGDELSGGVRAWRAAPSGWPPDGRGPCGCCRGCGCW